MNEDEPQSNDQFEHKTLTVRGVEYRLDELVSKDYDDCVELARDPETKDVDTVLLLKFMLPKSIVSPRISEAALNDLPMGARRELLQAVNDLHFPQADLKPMADLLRIAGYKVEDPPAKKDDSGKG